MRSRSSNLSSLKLQRCYVEISAIQTFQLLSSKLEKLRQLDLVLRKFDDHVKIIVFRDSALIFAQLTSFGFHSDYEDEHIKSNEFLELMSPSGSLTRLHLSGVEISPKEFHKFAIRNSNIEILHLNFCATIREDRSPCLMSIIKHFQHNLTELKLNGLTETSNSWYNSNDRFRALAYHPSLQVLHIANMYISSQAIIFVVRSLPRITNLTVPELNFEICSEALRKEKPHLVISLATSYVVVKGNYDRERDTREFIDYL